MLTMFAAGFAANYQVNSKTELKQTMLNFRKQKQTWPHSVH